MSPGSSGQTQICRRIPYVSVVPHTAPARRLRWAGCRNRPYETTALAQSVRMANRAKGEPAVQRRCQRHRPTFCFGRPHTVLDLNVPAEGLTRPDTTRPLHSKAHGQARLKKDHTPSRSRRSTHELCHTAMVRAHAAPREARRPLDAAQKAAILNRMSRIASTALLTAERN